MGFSSLDGGEDGVYNGLGLVETSKIFLTQDDFIYEAVLVIILLSLLVTQTSQDEM